MPACLLQLVLLLALVAQSGALRCHLQRGQPGGCCSYEQGPQECPSDVSTCTFAVVSGQSFGHNLGNYTLSGCGVGSEAARSRGIDECAATKLQVEHSISVARYVSQELVKFWCCSGDLCNKAKS